METQLPFPDYASFAYCCPDSKSRFDLTEVLRAFGIEASMMLDNDGIERDMFDFDLILNSNPSELMEELGWPGGGVVFAVDDPGQAANRLAIMLRAKGYTAKVVREKGSLADVHFVVTNITYRNVIAFRKTKFSMGLAGKPPKWDRKAA